MTTKYKNHIERI